MRMCKFQSIIQKRKNRDVRSSRRAVFYCMYVIIPMLFNMAIFSCIGAIFGWNIMGIAMGIHYRELFFSFCFHFEVFKKLKKKNCIYRMNASNRNLSSIGRKSSEKKIQSETRSWTEKKIKTDTTCF